MGSTIVCSDDLTICLEDLVLTIEQKGFEARTALLTPIESNLLSYLAENPNKALSKKELYQETWGQDYLPSGYENILTTHIHTLRKKLGPASEYIQTISCSGYRFTLPETSLSSLESIEFGKLRIYPDARRVFAGREEIKLRPKEHCLLSHFVENPDTPFSKKELYKEVWGSDFLPSGYRRTIETLLCSLRKKLGDASGYIKTIAGFGYVFNPPD